MGSSGYVSGAGARIWYRALGRGEPLVLLHGGPGADHSDFLPYLRPLARRFRLVLLDQRGCGRSPPLADPRHYTLAGMVADLEVLRRRLRIARWAVLGHSFGGILAQAYAIRHPRRVSRLILAGTASSARTVDADFRRIRQRLPASVRARLSAFERRGIYLPQGGYVPAYAALSARVLGPYMYARAAPPHAAPPIATDVLGEMWSKVTEFRITGNLKGFDFTRGLARLSIPVLVIAGDRDLVSGATLELTRRSCRHATLVVLGDCGHMMFVDHTRLFNEMVRAFLQQPHAGARRLRRGAP
ncbi:MAG: alpha/beta fold hydrolase [Proteobacteria bacterium]|nr:alpha/beta fold hydrolase [Pseudomonadota bacterium]